MVSRYGKEVVEAKIGSDYTAPRNIYNMLVAALKVVPNGKGSTLR